MSALATPDGHDEANSHSDDTSMTLSPSAAMSCPPSEPVEESETNLDEVAAPPPVYDPSERSIQHHAYLETQLSETNHSVPPSPEGVSKESEASTPDSTAAQKPAESHTKRRLVKFSRITCILSYLIISSIFGTLLRMVIECLTFYPGTPVNTSVLWANVGGSLIMGFLSEDQEIFCHEEVKVWAVEPERWDNARRTAHVKAHKKTVPLYIGLTTGFCGSLTSFSTFIRDVFFALANMLPMPFGPYADVSLFASAPRDAMAPNGGFSFMSIIAVLFSEVCLSLAGLFLGAHLAIAVSPWTPSLPLAWLRNVLDPIIVVLAWLSWAAMICLVILLPQNSRLSTIWSAELWRGPVLYALIFAPVGCLARFFISLKLNGRVPWFPMGTFTVNIGGTMVLGMAYTLQHASIGTSSLGGGSYIDCQVLQGIMDGFCGSLTTVSTWILELSDLRRRHAYLYGGVSVVVAFCALVVEIGSLKWTQGLVTPLCFVE
ncbi:uncharacterized protein N7498_006726 [Penicillium cinerascens]|uniref:CrcB-like protein-domain-containing protein n=1 Tax=Penicillium cinerascens TaxID=70096 RepID=A0A9W9MIS2_9EURO|nr:uncharacterized protein N7498_006726 [Penicillium cinerascens]KAJ5202063.1 hypothetical protein N7498_006726 [Penicillium cinerascens]